MQDYDEQIATLRRENRRTRQAGYNRDLRRRRRDASIPDARAVQAACWEFVQATTALARSRRSFVESVVSQLVEAGYDRTASERVVDRMAAKPSDVDTETQVSTH